MCTGVVLLSQVAASVIVTLVARAQCNVMIARGHR